MIAAAAVLMLLAAAPTPEHIREAELLAAKGVASYHANAFHAAGEYFLRAYRLSQEPTQLFNAAKAFEAAGERADARQCWTELATLPTASKADRKEARRHLIEREVERDVERDVVPEVVPPPAPIKRVEEIPPPKPIKRVEVTPPPKVKLVEQPPPPEPREKSITPWLLIAGGAASTTAGVVLYMLSASELNALEQRLAQREDGLITGIAYDDAVAARGHVSSVRAAGAIAIGVGLAGVAGGVALAFVPREDGGTVAYGGTW